MVAFSEIVLSYERLLMFKQQKFKISFTLFLIFSLFIELAVNSVFLFAFRVVPIALNRYSTLRTEFGNSTFYRVYVLLTGILQSLFSIVILVFLNILVNIKFKNYIRKGNLLLKNNLALTATIENSKSKVSRFDLTSKRMLTNKENAENKAEQAGQNKELNFTIMIVFSSLFFAFTRLVHLVGIVPVQLFPLVGLSINSDFPVYAFFVGQIFTIIYSASNLFVYLAFNAKFRNRFRKLFHLEK
jgi:hypothetical protein